MKDLRDTEVQQEEVNLPEGFKHLAKGYIDYVREVVTERAIPGIDGLKPSQRRILYTMKAIEKVEDLTKCQTIVGAVLKIHPHGDDSVYQTMVRMEETAGYMAVPYLKGKGSFGRIYSTTNKPAAARYTECKFNDIAYEFFGEMQGVTFIPSYDNKYQEPLLLPVSFPSILCNPTQGIAVGLSSNIPPFNFRDVNEAVIELIKTGKISKPLIPDYPSKGYYVYDEVELEKLMRTGRAKVKLRGRWHLEGKVIVIDELPYYTNIQEIIKAAEEIDGISDIRIENDRNNALRLAVECSNKKVMDYVLTELLRQTNLQMTIGTNIVVVIDNKPCVIGVTELLQRWVEFRKNVLTNQFKAELTSVLRSIPQYEILVELLSDEVKRSKFLTALTKESVIKAKDYLREIFSGTPETTFDWILGMSLRSLSGGASKIDKLESLRQRKAELEYALEHVDDVIIKQLNTLNSKYSYPRNTEVTNDDYEFEKKQTVVKAAPTPTKVVIANKFIKKLRLSPIVQELDGIECMSDDVISFIDTQGRLLRVNLDNLDFVTEKDLGVYLPTYLEVEDDFDIISYELITDKKVGYVYSDGFASVVDYSEWVDSRRCTRITTNGVSPLADLIVSEFNFDKTHLLLITKEGKFGFATTDFKQKHRTARTKLVTVKQGDAIQVVIPVDYTDMLKLVSAPERYVGKVSKLSNEDTFNEEFFDELLAR